MGDVNIKASDVAEFLKTDLIGDDIVIKYPSSINNIKENSILFTKRFSIDVLNSLNETKKICVLASSEYYSKLSCSYIVSNNPRLDFARILQKFFHSKLVNDISKTAIISDKVLLGNNVSIGEYTVIGNNVSIGDNTEIRHHVVISDNTVIGQNCLIKSNAVIGEEGFGFERDLCGVPVRVPHLGCVIIGNNVEIGASTVIAKGTLDATIINDNVKIDDQVFIAHNVEIGSDSLIIACSEISGSTKIGNGCWLGPNSTVMNNIKIGDNVFVGLGTVITKSIGDNLTVAGNPARKVEELKIVNKHLNNIIKGETGN